MDHFKIKTKLTTYKLKLCSDPQSNELANNPSISMLLATEQEYIIEFDAPGALFYQRITVEF